MKLILPSIEYEASYRTYIEELGNEERYPYPLDLDHSDFPALVHTLEQYSKGEDLPDWLVPNTTFWLVEGQEILACSHLRHCLNERLKYSGGHIGLGVRPSLRGKGLSSILLNATLAKAYAMGIKEAHIHCDANNIASKRMIESAGGLLNSQAVIKEQNMTILRYLISLP